MTAAQRDISKLQTSDPGIRADIEPFLDHLRLTASAARCKSYVDLFGACASLSRERHVAFQAASDLLMRCLSQALGQRPVWFRPGEAETSFDEDWLLALARALKREDLSSATFLLHSRVPIHARRTLIALLRNVVDNFDRI